MADERTRVEGASPLADPRLWLAAIVLLGALLRLYGLDVQSLWGDELYIRHLAALPRLRDAIALDAVEDVHPPGFVVLIYLTSQLLGQSEAMLRLPSAIAGIAALPAMFLLGRSVCSTRVGLRAAALAAVAWFPVYYSQECRAYSLLFFGSATLGYLAVETGRRYGAGLPGVRRHAAAMFLAALVLGYVHYFGLLFAALLGIALFWLALRKRFPMHILLWLYAAFFVAYLPWLASALAQVARGEIWIRQPSLASLAKPYAEMSNGRPLALLVLLLAGAGAAALGAVARRDRWLGLRGPRGRVVLLATAWAVLPTLIAFAISRVLLPVFTERNLIIVLPGLILLAALALDAIERRWLRGLALPSLLLIGWLLTDLIAVRDYYSRPTKHQFREAALRVIEANAGAGERPFVVAEVWYASYFDYYFRAFGSDVRVDVVPRTMDDRRLVAERRPANLWCLEVPPRRAGEPEKLRSYRGYRETARWSLHGWTVRQLRPSLTRVP